MFKKSLISKIFKNIFYFLVGLTTITSIALSLFLSIIFLNFYSIAKNDIEINATHNIFAIFTSIFSIFISTLTLIYLIKTYKSQKDEFNRSHNKSEINTLLNRIYQQLEIYYNQLEAVKEITYPFKEEIRGENFIWHLTEAIHDSYALIEPTDSIVSTICETEKNTNTVKLFLDRYYNHSNPMIIRALDIVINTLKIIEINVNRIELDKEEKDKLLFIVRENLGVNFIDSLILLKSMMKYYIKISEKNDYTIFSEKILNRVNQIFYYLR